MNFSLKFAQTEVQMWQLTGAKRDPRTSSNTWERIQKCLIAVAMPK